MIDRFFRPFLGGIFFDTDLNVTSRLLQFVMRMLATGQNCLPAQGIGAVSQQLAQQLPSSSIHTGEVSVPLPALQDVGQQGRLQQHTTFLCLAAVFDQVKDAGSDLWAPPRQQSTANT